MPIEFQKIITRKQVQQNRHKIYVFGDNLQHEGYGGQAKAMRGECNTIGIPTKFSPYEYFRESSYNLVIPIIKMYFDEIKQHLNDNKIIVIPEDGIGTGLAKLKTKAPNIWKYIKQEMIKLGWKP